MSYTSARVLFLLPPVPYTTFANFSLLELFVRGYVSQDLILTVWWFSSPWTVLMDSFSACR